MESSKLFTAYRLGSIELKNRMVMAPMTRSRSLGNVPGDLTATYYRQRAGAGLIITEGTSPSPNGLGYARIPGIYSEEQVQGWTKVTQAVHSAGGRIFMQMMHTGRVGHTANLPKGGRVIAPSAVKVNGQIWTDAQQMQDYEMPAEMTSREIKDTIEEFVHAAVNAIKAGFDGVELHAANGYLIEQFISPQTNQRTDEYGGTMENRCRFALEVTAAVAAAIGKDKTGIRLSPYGVNADMHAYPEIDATYNYLTKALSDLGIVYLHLVDHSPMGAPPVPQSLKDSMRTNFKQTMILCGGFNKESATKTLESGSAELIAFGRPFINNPDLVRRYTEGIELSTNFNGALLYTAGAEGYTDYPMAD